MNPEDKQPSAERQQTDESLRSEREKTDEALGKELIVVDATADAVLALARSRADALLAAARAKIDRQSPKPVTGAPLPATVQRERVLEDRAVLTERADADETLRAERAEHLELLSIDRQETDKDLLSERARSDAAIATRDEFLGIVSHDLRNMLNTMVLFAKLIEEGVVRENHAHDVVRYAQRIQSAGERMSRLIGDLVDLASIEAGALAVTREKSNPALVVTESVNAFHAHADTNSISLVAEIVPPLPLATFDPARIFQVLINLLSNAIKFTPAHGKVTVRVERLGDEVRFAVSDTGVGIPTDKLEAIFERFVQVTKNDQRGVGLGLYISKCIVQGHGGRIWAESELGRGSTFYVTLPLRRA